MATPGTNQAEYACRCLNVRIHPQSPTSPQPQSSDTDYTPLFVGDDGTSVFHKQLTLRSRTRAKEEVKDTDSLLTRYTSLTCLVCQTLVYRVFQVITPDIEGGEGPISPLDDRAEDELLKSSSGWIELYKDCITDEAIKEVEASPLYSTTFCILLPSGGSSSSSMPSYSTPSQSSSQSKPQTPQQYLPSLPPLFLPPPFTPLHSVFRHIASVASEESENIRAEAEGSLTKIIQDEVEKIQAKENKLRMEVELIWSTWREVMHKLEQDATARGRAWAKRRSSSINWVTPAAASPPTAPVAQSGTPASIRIRDFSPIHSPSRRASTSPKQASSALSASLKTSSFQYPNSQRSRSSGTATPNGSGSPPPYSSNPPSPDRAGGTRVLSPATASSRTIPYPISEAATIRDAYRRNMDQMKDFATSFNYVVDMEAKMQEIQKHQEQNVQSKQEAVPSSDVVPLHPQQSSDSTPRGRTARTSKSAIKKAISGQVHSDSPEKNNRSVSRGTKGEQDPTTPTKGKRKVTFDVKPPDVAIINSDAITPQLTDPSWKEEPEAIFDMESEDTERIVDQPTPTSTTPTDQTQESIRAPFKPSRTRELNMSGLPSSLANVRPMSLPLPATIRTREQRSEPAEAERPRSEVVREALLSSSPDQQRKPQSTTSTKSPEITPLEAPEVEEEELDPRDAEILRLVAASTPSHRAAWKKDSKAWQVFVSRQGSKAKGVDRSVIQEEEEDSAAESSSSRQGYEDESDDSIEEEQKDSFVSGIASSLPIPIGPIGHTKIKFGHLEYQVKTSLADRPGIIVPAFQKSTSEAMRRASYAQRDLARPMDPGALDFASIEEGDEEDEAVDSELDGVGGKGRQRALKILKARNEIPDAGMWRSLA